MTNGRFNGRCYGCVGFNGEVQGRGHAIDIVTDMIGACHVRIRSTGISSPQDRLGSTGRSWPVYYPTSSTKGINSSRWNRMHVIAYSPVKFSDVSSAQYSKHVCACALCAKSIPHTPIRRAHTPVQSSTTIKLEIIKAHLLSFPELFMLKVRPAPPLIICSQELRAHTRFQDRTDVTMSVCTPANVTSIYPPTHRALSPTASLCRCVVRHRVLFCRSPSCHYCLCGQQPRGRRSGWRDEEGRGCWFGRGRGTGDARRQGVGVWRVC